MKFSKYFNSILLGYLVLILNFGPSFHRAPIFGLHDHGTDVAEAEFVCSCGRHHEPIQAAENRDDSNSQNSPQYSAIEKCLCDCSLCQFFKQYHASIQLNDQWIDETILFTKFETNSSLASRTAFASDARGPPVV